MMGYNDIFLVISTKCNLDCKYCYVQKSIRHKQYEYDEAARAVSDKFILKAITEGFYLTSLSLHGSETTIISAECLGDIINKLSDVCGNIDIQSNGVNLGNDEYFNAFISTLSGQAKSKLSIGISLDGPKEVHNCYRGNSYDRAYKGLINVINAGLCGGILGTITDKTLDNLPDMLDWVTGLKDKYNLIPSMQYLQGSTYFTKEMEKTWVDWCVKNDLLPLIHSISNNYSNRGNSCPQIMLGMNGQAYGCNRHYGENTKPLCNWHITPMETIVKVKANLFNSISYPVNPECKKCSSYFRCFGGCPVIRTSDHKAYDCFTKKYLQEKYNANS